MGMNFMQSIADKPLGSFYFFTFVIVIASYVGLVHVNVYVCLLLILGMYLEKVFDYYFL